MYMEIKNICNSVVYESRKWKIPKCTSVEELISCVTSTEPHVATWFSPINTLWDGETSSGEGDTRWHFYRQFKSTHNSIYYLWKFTCTVTWMRRTGIVSGRERLGRCTGQEYREGSSSVYNISFLKSNNVKQMWQNVDTLNLDTGYLCACSFPYCIIKIYLPKMVSLFSIFPWSMPI